MNDIPCGNNEARGPRKLKHILKVPFAFQPASLFFDDNAVAAMVLLPKRLLPEDGPETTREGGFTFRLHHDDMSCTRLNTRV